MYSEDFQADAMDQEEVVEDDNLDLESSEFEDEENAYLVNDEELDEGFQFQG
ncbi:MAG TPA: hypothetical protein VFA52_03355 [Candidatus Paceibacterota bacterium]|nr:hypothetical protein [Candidatus Paceibacterota bacterium]